MLIVYVGAVAVLFSICSYDVKCDTNKNNLGLEELKKINSYTSWTYYWWC